uniref:hypothetical protein n=1 Tax=Methanohalobium sp. TaxID=2837493 RepID=UPI0025CED079
MNLPFTTSESEDQSSTSEDKSETSLQTQIISVISKLGENISESSTSNERGSVNYYFDVITVGIFAVLYQLYPYSKKPHIGLLDWKRFRNEKQNLKELNSPITVDVFVIRLISLGSILGIAGIFIGYALSQVAAPLLITIDFGFSSVPLWIRVWVEENISLILSIIFVPLFCFSMVAVVFYSMTSWLGYKVREKKREIDDIYPQAVKYQYALAQSGANVKDLIYTTANQGKNYGVFSEEMQDIVNYVERDNKNLLDAIDKKSSETVSQNFAELLKDYSTVLEQGADNGIVDVL